MQIYFHAFAAPPTVKAHNAIRKVRKVRNFRPLLVGKLFLLPGVEILEKAKCPVSHKREVKGLLGDKGCLHFHNQLR